MTLLLAGVVVLLLAVIAALIYKSRQKHTDLLQIADRLRAIVADEAPAQLLYASAEPDVQSLLAAVNELLIAKERTTADYRRTEIAMRKMLSNISHDLKTPLTVMLGSAESVLHQPDMSSERRELLIRKVHGKGLELIELIDKFFDLAKLEAGDRELQLADVHMNDICSEHLLAFYDMLEADGFRVEADIPEQPIYALADKDALSRVLNNLLSNAIRHGGEGRMLGFTLRADADWVYCVVADQGKGIDEQHGDFVFERLYTLDDSRNSRYAGSGLGLTITKRLVELMGGRVSFHSKPNVRTEFTVQLPRVRRVSEAFAAPPPRT